MIQRFCKGVFTRDYKKTIGVDFLERIIEYVRQAITFYSFHLLELSKISRVNGEEVRLMLWDTAGQEEFDAITKAYYRGAQAAVLAFSTVDRVSFDAIRAWKKKVLVNKITADCQPDSYIVARNGPNRGPRS